MGDILKVSSLVTQLRNGVRIVDDISFNIRAGETFALLGESGCGKSMTALSLMRLLPDGVVHAGWAAQLDGIALFGLREREMRDVRGGRMAMIFQEPGLSLNPVMTVGQQIAEVLGLHQGMHGAAAQTALRGIAGSGRHSGCGSARCGISVPAFRRHEAARDDRDGAGRAAEIADRGRADHRAGCHDTGAGAAIAARHAGSQRHGDAADNARPRRGGGNGASGRCDVCRANRRAGEPYPVVRPAAASLYAEIVCRTCPVRLSRNQSLAAIPGSVPPLGSVMQGCRFAARCDKAWSLCHEKTPDWTEVGEGQGVRCHLYSAVDAEVRRVNGEEGRVDAGLAVVPSPLSLPPSLLEVSDLRVHFPIRKGVLQRVVGQVKAVDGVSLDIPQGRTLALVGESGCGKTTLAKALLQLIPAVSGRVQLAGQTLSGYVSREQRASMQMVFQDPYASLNPKMRVAEILEEGMAALDIDSGSAARQAHIDTLLDQVGLARGAKWRYPHEFSGGQRQRIAIARALAVSPRMLICDEPTSALDVSVQAQILNLLKSLQQKFELGYLFITHNLAVVEYLAHEVCVMYLGRIVERGTAAEVLRSPMHPYTRALLSAVPRIDGPNRERIRLEGDLPSPANPPHGCHFSPRCAHATEQCRTLYPPSTRLSPTHSVSCYLHVENPG